MSFKDLGSVAGITDEQGHEAATFLAEKSRDHADGWWLLEACGLVPYESGKPPRQPAEQAAVIKYPVRGQ